MNHKIIIFILLLCISCKGMGQETQKLSNLPLIILPAKATADRPLVFFISGDGGWKNFDPSLAGDFVKTGSPVVALNALHYFWAKKTPKETAETVAQILSAYMRQWHKDKFILVGYSFGADVMPFIANRLSQSIMSHCEGLVLFSPGASTDFEIHFSQMLNNNKKWAYSVVDEIKAMKNYKMICYFGKTEEANFPVWTLKRPNCEVIYLPGDHHYDLSRQNLAKDILDKLKQ